jgi:hypothetical protein
MLHNLSLAQLVKKFLPVNGTTRLIYYYVHKTDPLGLSHTPFLKSPVILSVHLNLCITTCPFHHVSLYISYCIHLIPWNVLLLKFLIRYTKAINDKHKKCTYFSVRRDKFIPTCDVNLHTRNDNKDKMAVVKCFFLLIVRLVNNGIYVTRTSHSAVYLYCASNKIFLNCTTSQK